MISPFHILGAVENSLESGSFIDPDSCMVEFRIPMEKNQVFLYQSPVSRLGDGTPFVDESDLSRGVWNLRVIENLRLSQQTGHVRKLAGKESTHWKDRKIRDCWLAGMCARLYGTMGHPGIEIGRVISPELKEFITSVKNYPEFIGLKLNVAKDNYMREILSIMDRFPNGDLDGDSDEKFTVYHGVTFTQKNPGEPVETGVLCMNYPNGSEKNFWDVRESVESVAVLTEQAFAENPCQGFEKYLMTEKEAPAHGPSM